MKHARDETNRGPHPSQVQTKKMTRSFPAVFILLVACSSSNGSGSTGTAPTQTAEPTATSPEPTTQPTSQPTTTTAPTASAPPANDGPAGSWTSASCGNRKYVRDLDLKSDGSFAAHDLVSPCPPDAKCVWSGIVDRKGTWKLEGDKVSLSFTDANKQAGDPLPSSLGWSGGVLKEGSCNYSRR